MGIPILVYTPIRATRDAEMLSQTISVGDVSKSLSADI